MSGLLFKYSTALSSVLRIMNGNVARGSVSAAVLQVAELTLGFIVVFLLSRALGAAELGVYTFGVSVAGLLSVPAILGYDTLAARDVARCRAAADWFSLKLFMRTALVRVLASSAIVVVVACLMWSLFPIRFLDESLATSALVALILVPLLALLKLHESTLRGFGRIWLAFLPSKIVRPAAMVVLGATSFLLVGLPSSGVQALVMAAVVCAMGLTLAIVYWRRVQPSGHGPGKGTACISFGWRDTFAFAGIAGVLVVNNHADILMLGALGTPEDVGIYRVAGRMAMLVSFGVSAVGLALGPRIAALYSGNRLADVESVVSTAAVASFASALPVAFLLVVLGPRVLPIFGDNFVEGTPVLFSLSISYLALAIVGPVGLLLVMVGQEKQVSLILAAGGVANVVLNAVLIPLFGPLGAALATGISTVCCNLAMVVRSLTALRINPTLLGLIWPCRRDERTAAGVAGYGSSDDSGPY
jgi:O-antigen/teichoic acid export membrane protein